MSALEWAEVRALGRDGVSQREIARPPASCRSEVRGLRARERQAKVGERLPYLLSALKAPRIAERLAATAERARELLLEIVLLLPASKEAKQ